MHNHNDPVGWVFKTGLLTLAAVACLIMLGCGGKDLPPSVETITQTERVTVFVDVPKIERVEVPVATKCEVEIPDAVKYNRAPDGGGLYDKAKAFLLYHLSVKENNDKMRTLLEACAE